ncbi:MAG: hypothetical protein LC745_05360, partial [Planctomycetia bacterium]|nr:hypothetical protein [Planctomycetia bacterium]
PGLPDVPPGGHHTAHAVSCATQMAAALIKPGPADEAHRRLLDLGVGVAEGRLGWEQPRSAGTVKPPPR